MKKNLIIFPLILLTLFSCNKNSGSDVPFPEDTYKSIGFALADNEKSTRILKDSEIELVKSTTDEYDKYITKSHSVIQSRNYERVFADEFKSGYDSSNKMEAKTEDVFYQEEKTDKTTGDTLPIRCISNSESNKTEKYSYGNISEKINTKSIKYASIADPTSTFGYVESENLEKAEGVRFRNVIKRNSAKKSNITDEEYKVADPEESDFYIKQSEYLTKTYNLSGANDKNEVILVNETRSPHGSSGEYVLKDGKKYKSMDNSIYVIKLELVPAVLTGENKTLWDKDWYLVNYARTYTETTITSEVIDPNVPVKDLETPFIIKYEEKITNFYISEITRDDSELPEKEEVTLYE